MDTLEAIDSFETLVTLVRTQTNQLLGASRLAVTTQSVGVAAIEDILANVEASLTASTLAVGQTQAIQVGNQLSGQVVAILAQMQGAQLAAQRVEALRIAQEASRQKAAEDLSRRLNDADQYANTQFPGVLPDGWPR